MRSASLAVVALMMATAAHAEVTDKSASGFEVRQTIETTAAPDAAFTALLAPSKWWSSSHTFSGLAGNLTVDLERRCLCEVLPDGGFVRHMSLIYIDGSRALTFEGAMGPLSRTGAAGHLTWVVKPTAGGSTVTFTYDVGGYAKGGLAEVWAGPVDGMFGEQIGRLKAYLDTGKPD
jgi:hypothetical protein